MKILVIGDPHGKLPKNLEGVVKKERPEVIVVTGEIPPVPINWYYPRGVKKNFDYADKKYAEIVNELCSFDLPVIVLKGNAYVSEKKKPFVRKLFSRHSNLHYKRTGKVDILGQRFILFDQIWEKWAYPWMKSFSHADSSRSQARMNHLYRLMGEAKDPILVSHCPPYGKLDVVLDGKADKSSKGKHVGSKVVLDVIKKHQPRYVFCGHIHEGKGQGKIGKTQVYNVGFNGDYIILDI